MTITIDVTSWGDSLSPYYKYGDIPASAIEDEPCVLEVPEEAIVDTILQENDTLEVVTKKSVSYKSIPKITKLILQREPVTVLIGSATESKLATAIASSFYKASFGLKDVLDPNIKAGPADVWGVPLWVTIRESLRGQVWEYDPPGQYGRLRKYLPMPQYRVSGLVLSNIYNDMTREAQGVMRELVHKYAHVPRIFLVEDIDPLETIISKAKIYPDFAITINSEY